MSLDEQHVALPKLYGAPAYGRPPAPVEAADRPFDPDELPIEAAQSAEEREFRTSLPARAYAPGGIALTRNVTMGSGSRGELRPRTLSLRAIAGRILRDS
ncbi:MAG: hypothetical protein ABI553_08535 [Chloroflexota bacterium]